MLAIEADADGYWSAPRAATVVAKTQGTLWALDRISFRTILLDVSSSFPSVLTC
jgi:CRP-like cAMP-binding protein